MRFEINTKDGCQVIIKAKNLEEAKRIANERYENVSSVTKL